MEMTEKMIGGRNVRFMSLVEETTFETYFNVELEGYYFRMMIVDNSFKIVNPETLPEWLLGMEDQLSDHILHIDK